MLNRRTLILTAAATAAAPYAHAQGGFDAFVRGVKAEAKRAGIRDATLEQAFAGVVPNPRVIELDRRQPEFTLTWPEYRARVLPDSRIQAARDNYARERTLLAQVNERYGVDPLIIVGIWGVESAFGTNKGNFRLVESLSTLAWEGRRAAFFRSELLNVLRILDQGDVSAARLTGGWAGAMGQPQFMPSSYLRSAVDFDGDGRRDIWDSKPDVFGSIANYLAKAGWRRNEPWAQPVRLPAGFDTAGAGRDKSRALGDWMRAGVRRDDGRDFGRTDVMGAVVVPTGAAAGEGYMTYPNFNVIRRYNPSDFYALAVGLLGEAAG
ncbi:MAG: lytic murein transglycosylase [Gemmatimonadaceae bacterium]|nr:lytic murein transglycosylase [Acetobacteraceae bacterium]